MAIDDALLLEARSWRRRCSQPENARKEGRASVFVSAQLEAFGPGAHRGLGDTGVAGAQPDVTTPDAALHNPHCDFNDDVVAYGIGCWTAVARQQLGQTG
jgi:metal-dependent amidase/aminoacylase/carboxypeptidase family protein